jgi:hypothetical protein
MSLLLFTRPLACSRPALAIQMIEGDGGPVASVLAVSSIAYHPGFWGMTPDSGYILVPFWMNSGLSTALAPPS